MGKSPETESLPFEKRAEDFSEIPVTVENKGVVNPVTAIPSQFTAQVTDDKGNPLIQTPSREEITIEIPGTKEELTALSKGTPDEAIAWFGTFWLRTFKKAVHFGWRVISGGGRHAT